MAIYSICSINIESEVLSKSYLPFLVPNEKGINNINLTIKQVTDPHQTNNLIKVVELPLMSIWKDPDTLRWIYKPSNGICSISINSDYSDAEYYCSDIISFLGKNRIDEILGQYFRVLIECKLIQSGFCILHSACVEINGVAFAFTGPSGIGKSTRAKKWCELLSANWISGDRPAINASQGIVYGVPWDGKEAIYRNVNYPLGAILKVKRSESTYIKRMTFEEKMQLLYEQTLFPMWDDMLVAKVMYYLKNLINKIPIYELCSDITDESIIKAYKTVIEKINNTGGENDVN